MSKIIEDYIKNNQFGKHLDMEFKILAPGHIEYYLSTKKNLEAILGLFKLYMVLAYHLVKNKWKLLFKFHA